MTAPTQADHIAEAQHPTKEQGMNQIQKRRNEAGVSDGLLMSAAFVVLAAVFFGLVIGGWFGVKAMHRHQQIADAKNAVQTSQIRANNQTKLNQIRIAQQAQLVKVAQQNAQIRFETSRGVREAQDEIAQTLTPLYVQFEMVEALKEVANSGKNNTVVYLPSGNAGIPLIAGAAGQPSVGGAK